MNDNLEDQRVRMTASKIKAGESLGLGEGMDGEGGAIVDTHFAHQAADVRLDGALINAECESDLTVGMPLAQQIEDLAFARGEMRRGWGRLRGGPAAVQPTGVTSAGRPRGA